MRRQSHRERRRGRDTESDSVSKVSARLGAEVARVRNCVFLTVKVDVIGEACRLVVEDGRFYHLSTITGLDEGETIGILYHFWSGREFVTVKTSVPKTDPTLPSIAASLPAALFYEAEVMDLLGVSFDGNPLVGKKLLLPDSYPTNAPRPLRKEADPEQIRRMMELE